MSGLVLIVSHTLKGFSGVLGKLLKVLHRTSAAFDPYPKVLIRSVNTPQVNRMNVHQKEEPGYIMIQELFLKPKDFYIITIIIMINNLEFRES